MVSATVPSATSPDRAIALRVTGLVKNFPGVRALREVDFDVRSGEIHAVVGENGAGKSTLMRIIAGSEHADAGEIDFYGEPLGNIDEHAAGELGISMVHQERSLVPELSVAENMFAGRQPANFAGAIRWKAMNRRAAELLESLHVRIEPTARVGDLSPAEQQTVEIAKALSRDLRLLILDEPTAALTLAETRHLFDVARQLRAQGVAIIYISHRLAEVLELADRVTVLRDGAVTGASAVVDTSEEEMIRLMVGRALVLAREATTPTPGSDKVLVLEHVCSPPSVADATLTVHSGEIVCLAGLIGAGRTEVCETVFGVRGVESGRIVYRGKRLQPKGPGHARRAGIAMVPEDRKDAGLFLDMDVSSNVVAASLVATSRWGLMSRRTTATLVSDLVQRLNVRTPSLAQPVGKLSGGNQQKVLLAKWLAVSPQLLIVDEPTRGVDVGARAEIYDILRELARGGMAILAVSSDLPEVLTLAHRIVVMREGHTVGELPGDATDEEQVMRLASAGEPANGGAAWKHQT